MCVNGARTTTEETLGGWNPSYSVHKNPEPRKLVLDISSYSQRQTETRFESPLLAKWTLHELNGPFSRRPWDGTRRVDSGFLSSSRSEKSTPAGPDSCNDHQNSQEGPDRETHLSPYRISTLRLYLLQTTTVSPSHQVILAPRP